MVEAFGQDVDAFPMDDMNNMGAVGQDEMGFE